MISIRTHSRLATLGVALVCTLTAHSALAQPPAGLAQGGLGGLQELMKGLNVGPLMMSFGGASGMTVDFTRSNERNLLKRADVRSELFIDSKQREQLEGIEVQGKQQMQQMVMESVMKNFANNPDLKNLGQGGGPPDFSQLKDVINSGLQDMQTSLAQFQTTQDQKGETLLRPKQVKRLHELDLQWRGLLALSDPKVAEDMKATQEQRNVVDAALRKYMDTQMQIMQPIMMQAAQLGQQAAQGGNPQGRMDPAAMQKTLTDAMEGDEIKKARAEAESKVSATLTAEQKLQWKQMIGQKFYFRRLDK